RAIRAQRVQVLADARRDLPRELLGHVVELRAVVPRRARALAVGRVGVDAIAVAAHLQRRARRVAMVDRQLALLVGGARRLGALAAVHGHRDLGVAVGDAQPAQLLELALDVTRRGVDVAGG